MLEAVRDFLAWLDRNGLALFIGFALGALSMRHFHLKQLRAPACYYHQWLAEFTARLRSEAQKTATEGQKKP